MSQNASTLVCPKCATSYSTGTRFCSTCGTDVSGARPAAAGAEMATATIERDDLLPLVMEGTLGEYDIYGLLGRGGMASVYLALDLSLNRKVAIKVMSPALLNGDDAIARFIREAQTAANLSHPHIIPIYGVKQAPRIVYFVMKFIEGRPLDSIIKEVGALPVEMATSILAQVGAALQYAHKRGVVHRDIKPANIMIDEDGHAIVTDFGIAKVQEAKGLTMTGATVGTPAYMSPEQYEARNITGAADQYSLGVVAYEMLTGHPPFGGDSIMTVMKGHLLEAPPSIAAERADLPPSIASTVMKMLEKKQEDRFEDLAHVVEALDAKVLSDSSPAKKKLVELAKTGAMMRPRMSVPMSPVPKGKATPVIPTPVVEPVAPAPRPAVPEKKSNGALIGGIAAAVVVLGGGGFYMMQQKSAPPVEQASLVAPASAPAVVAAPAAGVAAPTTSAPATDPATAVAGAAPVAGPPVVPTPSEPAVATPIGKQPTVAKSAKKDVAAKAPVVDEAELARQRAADEAAKLSGFASGGTSESSRLSAAASTQKGGAKGTTGSLVIGLNVEGGKLEINGEPKGTLGTAMRTFTVKAGAVRWIVRKDGCLAAEGLATVDPGATVTVAKGKATPPGCN